MHATADMMEGEDTLFDAPEPTAMEDKEAYFMAQLQMGETLAAKGPVFYEKAATCFYKALRIYPEPMNLLMIFQQSLPEPVLAIVMEKMAADVRSAKGADAPDGHIEEIADIE